MSVIWVPRVVLNRGGITVEYNPWHANVRLKYHRVQYKCGEKSRKPESGRVCPEMAEMVKMAFCTRRYPWLKSTNTITYGWCKYLKARSRPVCHIVNAHKTYDDFSESWPEITWTKVAAQMFAQTEWRDLACCKS